MLCLLQSSFDPHFSIFVRTMFMFYLVTPLNCSLLLWSFDQTWDWLRTSNVHVATSSNTFKFLKVFKEWRRIQAIMIIPKIWVVRTRWFMFDPEYQLLLSSQALSCILRDGYLGHGSSGLLSHFSFCCFLFWILIFTCFLWLGLLIESSDLLNLSE